MLTQLVIWLNALANVLGDIALAPIAWLPGWLSATLIAAVTGVLMLLAFKYTSNQAAIKRTRNGIKANLLALSLFKDSMAVSLRSQGRILRGAGRLLVLSIVPILVMLVPMSLLLGQIALWYQAAPVPVGADSVVTVQVAENATEALSQIELAPSSTFECTIGPVRVPAKNLVCWNIQPREPGEHELSFTIGGESVTKELAVGDGFRPASLKRPAWSWTDALVHPRERPFAADSPIQSIEIVYPERSSWTTGTGTWLIYWFVVSLIAAFLAKPLLKVNV
jgi:hypothetical protein